MKECPICGAKAKRRMTKKRFLAGVVSWLVGWPIGILGGINAGNDARETIHKRICKQTKYRCTDPRCGHEWLEKRED